MQLLPRHTRGRGGDRTRPCFSAEPEDAGALCRSAGTVYLAVHRRDEEGFEPGLLPSLLALTDRQLTFNSS